MAGNNAIQFLRGTSSDRKSSISSLLAGQPFYETDTNLLYVGSGSESLLAAKPVGNLGWINFVIWCVLDSGQAIKVCFPRLYLPIPGVEQLKTSFASDNYSGFSNIVSSLQGYFGNSKNVVAQSVNILSGDPINIVGCFIDISSTSKIEVRIYSTPSAQTGTVTTVTGSVNRLSSTTSNALTMDGYKISNT